MITVERKRILVAGTPRVLISGEVHYFRLPREAWEDRLRKLKAAGGTTVASYIPWLCHELPDGSIDLDGHTRPELDLGAFIDLCHRHGLFFIARPGPFIMAEMKNEGIPYRIYTAFPEAVPVGWDGKRAPTKTVDYLAPRFLDAVDGWYAAVMPLLATRLIQHGGPIVAVQLDNEVGMLSWVSNGPVLTDLAITEFRSWLGERYDAAALAARYPFAGDDDEAWRRGVRSPGEGWALALMQDLGHYRRDRYARYFAILRGMAEARGVRDVPFLINVHGTEHGGGASYPIGISQLYKSWRQAPGYLPGSDHYLGNLTVGNAPDWYLMNAFTEAVSLPDQPLTSLEFEAGEGDYGGSAGTRLDPSAADFKLRMAVAQGNRLINYYLFTGGYNWRLPEPSGDGNDRISFTGERHGTGAPVNPEGQLSYTLPRLARAHRAIAALEPTLATADEERDALAVGFIPDDFMTESVYPGSAAMGALRDDLVASRFGGPNQAIIRGLMQLHLRYTAVDLQDPASAMPPALALGSTRAMAAEVQRRLAGWLRDGGRLFLVGEVPETDLEGNACTILADALGVRPVSRQEGGWTYYLSVAFSGWAAGRAEVRADWSQGLDAGGNEVFASVYGSGDAVGLRCAVGQGEAFLVTAAIPPDRWLYREMLRQLGVEPALAIDPDEPGVFLSSARSADTGGRVVNLLNLDGYDKVLTLTERGEPLFGGNRVTLLARDGLMLPLDVAAGGCEIAWATAEVADVTADTATFRLTGAEVAIALRHDVAVVAGEASIEGDGGLIVVRASRASPSGELLTLRRASAASTTTTPHL
jgi:beta-galactosidase